MPMTRFHRARCVSWWGTVRGGLVLLSVALFLSCAREPAPTGDPSPALPDGEWVDEALAGMDLRETAAQLVFPWIPGGYQSRTDPEFLELLEWVEQGIGGVVISIGTPHSYAAKLNALQEAARLPLLVSSDFESGGPGMRINHSYALPSLLAQGGGTSFPPTMAFGAIGDEAYTREMARITAQEARAVGVHMNFAPVVDVNSNPDNPIINTRAFGEDPDQVSRFARAYIEGARQGGVLTTAKHFPGHGDTRVDSHLELPEVTADRERLERVELVPFQAAVEAGVDGVMTAHVSVPEVLGPDAPPATFSREFMTDLLQGEMGFEGLVVTDALRMGAITERYGGGEAAVLAVEAGADVVLVPESVSGAVEALVEAVESGRLGEDRLRRSARKILEVKASMGLHEDRLVPLGRVDRVVGTGENLAFADSAAGRSITLPRDRDGLVPADLDRVERVLSVTYARRTDLVAGREFDPYLATFFEEVVAARVDDETSDGRYRELLEAAREADLVLVSAYLAPQAGAGSVDVPESLARFVEEVDGEGPLAVLSFGNPYLLSAFPTVGTYLLAWGDREVSQRAAVRGITGAASIGGRLPVTLPPFHERGEGLDREADPLVAERARERGDALDEAGLVRGTDDDPDGDPENDDSEGGHRENTDPEEGANPGDPDPAPGSGEEDPAEPPETAWFGEADPPSLGFSAEGLAELDSVLTRAVETGVTPGAALAVGRSDGILRLRGYGRLDHDPESPEAGYRSIYDVASLTKPVATATAVMLLAEEGKLDLDDPVSRHLEGWLAGEGRDGDERPATIRDLLLHRSGLPAWRPWFQEHEGPEAFRSAAAGLELRGAGAATEYSDLGFMVLGWLVEEVAGEPLDRFLSRRVWEPLGMDDTGFLPDPELRHRIAPTEVDREWRGRHIHGEVHDPNAYAMGGVAGHAGLFSSARDLALFARTLLGEGVLPSCEPGGSSSLVIPCRGEAGGPVRLLGGQWVAVLTGRVESGGGARTPGWDSPSGRSSAGDYLSARAFGHTGYTGTSLWVDPELDLFVILLTNRVNPTSENTGHIELRREVHDLAAQALTDREVHPRSP